jgi:hypothetical protein
MYLALRAGEPVDGQKGTAMSLLDKLLHRTKPVVSPTVASGPCLHVTLVPKWDSVADMGHEDSVSSYKCDSCGQSFTAVEGRVLRQSEAERLRQQVGADTSPAT